MDGYFRSYTESHEGVEGDFYCEVVNNLIVRHISVFNGVYYWATFKEHFDEHYDFTDRPEFDVGDGDIPISKEQFEGIWQLSLKQ